MNPVPFSLALLATATFAFSQAAPAPAAPAPAATSAPAAKPKPLGSADKTFVKNAGESLYYLINLSEKTKRNAGSEETKKLGAKLLGDFNKMYGDIGGVATSSGEMMPNELKGSDKSNAGKLGKLETDKFDAEYLELTGKELKKLTRYFESGAKMVQNADLKAAAEKWAPTVKGFADEVETTEKAAKDKGRKK